MIIFIIPRMYPWLYSDCDSSLWICMDCSKLCLLYLIIIALRATGKISLLLLTMLPSWNKVITYLLTYNNAVYQVIYEIELVFERKICIHTDGSSSNISWAHAYPDLPLLFLNYILLKSRDETHFPAEWHEWKRQYDCWRSPTRLPFLFTPFSVGFVLLNL